MTKHIFKCAYTPIHALMFLREFCHLSNNFVNGLRSRSRFQNTNASSAVTPSPQAFPMRTCLEMTAWQCNSWRSCIVSNCVAAEGVCIWIKNGSRLRQSCGEGTLESVSSRIHTSSEGRWGNALSSVTIYKRGSCHVNKRRQVSHQPSGGKNNIFSFPL